MNAHFHFDYLVMKGLGPEWIQKDVEVFLDDLDDGLSDEEVEQMAIVDAEKSLKEAGFYRHRRLQLNKKISK